MAISSSANIIVDPDGDLILLLSPTIPDFSKSDSSSPANSGAIDTLDDDMSTELHIIRVIEGGFSETSQDEPTPIYNDHILVSSKHMSLASPVFKAMLQGGFKEAITLKTTGKLELPLPDDDPPAMKILIHIIHGRMNMVPLNIDLELFTQIAILVDKYECREVVRLLPPIWSDGLSDSFETSWINVARWVCIAWQFELEDEFLIATQIIREKSKCSLETLMNSINYDLPIPKYVVGKFSTMLSMKFWHIINFPR